MKNKKITISWILFPNYLMMLDFGVFPAHKKNQIKVDANFWKKYCEMRANFEAMQTELAYLVDGKISPKRK